MAKDWKKVRRNEQTLVKNLTKKKGKKIFDTEPQKSYCRGYLAALTLVKKEVSFFLKNREEKKLSDGYVQQQIEITFLSAVNYLKNLEGEKTTPVSNKYLEHLEKEKKQNEKIIPGSMAITDVDSSGM